MHPLQQHILRQLMRHEHCRYSELKPDEVEGNLFVYHLRQLLNREWIVKEDDLYTLTVDGKKQVARLSSGSMNFREQPVVCTMVLARQDGKVLLHRRSYEPFRGKLCLPYGKLHWGESLEAAAKRELMDKTGLQGNLSYVGCINFRVSEGGELIAHYLFHAFRAETLSGHLSNAKGECLFTSSIDVMACMAGIDRMIEAIDSGQSLVEISLGD